MNLYLGQFEPIWYPTKVTVKFMTNQTFHNLNGFFFFFHTFGKFYAQQIQFC